MLDEQVVVLCDVSHASVIGYTSPATAIVKLVKFINRLL
jgi:hypothetical protein